MADHNHSDKPTDIKKGLLKNKKLLWAVIGGVLAIMIAVVVVFASSFSGNPTNTPTVATTSPTPTPTPALLASNLDGVLVPVALATRHPLGLMVENHTQSRPQSGLSDASIVYESIVEGGITRFMAVFAHTLPSKVGPIRSARTQFLDFAQEYTPVSAYYGHVGGAEDALNKIRADKIYDLDQFSVGTKAYKRIPKAGVATEHTMYGYPDQLYQVAKDKGYKENSEFRSWKFKDDTALANRPEAQTITIPFSSALYEVKYVYDKTTNSYRRYMGGTEHKDANNSKTIAPRNVIIQFVTYSTINNKGVQGVGTLGQGTAKVFRDGLVTEAKWQKASVNARTIYTDAATGAEIEFNRGQLFVELPKVGTTITVQ